MPYKLSYTAVLQQTDNSGNPNGEVFSFAGSQNIGVANPQTADLQAAATAMGNDVSAQMVAKFPVQLAEDSDNGGAGGGG